MHGIFPNLQKRIGVTRLANITGLDFLGYPVVAAVRPRSLNLSVGFGKGPTQEIAMLSALMEAAELYFSETPPHPPIRGSYSGLDKGSALDPRKLKPLIANKDLASLPLDWVSGNVLGTGRPVLVPWEIISMDYSLAAREVERHFEFGATGLAAGLDQTSATLHGLYEVIERDRHNAWNLCTDDERAGTLVELPSVRCLEIRRLLKVVETGGLCVLAWDLSGPANIPCYLVELLDLRSRAATAYVQGVAAHLSAATALQMALAEALQIRLTYISGSRDDLDWDDYGDRFSAIVENRREFLEAAANGLTLPVETVPLTDDAALVEVLRRLERQGIGEIVAVSLAGKDELVSVMKVIVPQMRDIQEMQGRSTPRSFAEEIFA
jgi:ribosomal protein S12 methylthiotransferase accessory factor